MVATRKRNFIIFILHLILKLLISALIFILSSLELVENEFCGSKIALIVKILNFWATEVALSCIIKVVIALRKPRNALQARTSQVFSQLAIAHQKGLIILHTAGGVLADFWVPNEIDSLNFQHMLLFWLNEASQNFSLFRQLFFHSFQGGTKGKMLKNQCRVMAIFQHFYFGPPLETMNKRVV